MSRYYDDKLYHHGIKGQKWGVRRFQQENGTLTAAGKKRYDSGSSPKKSIVGKTIDTYSKNYKERVTQQYEKAGLDRRSAEAAAERKAKFMRNVAIGAGVTFGAVAFYGAYKYKGNNYTEYLLKKGDTLQTLSHDRDRLLKGQQFYTNFLKGDKTIYEGTFGGKIGDINTKKFALEAPLVKDLKIASHHTGKQTYKELLKNDPEFKQSAKNIQEKLSLYKIKYGKGYDFFNSVVLPRDEKAIAGKESMAISKKFYDSLSKKGYGGVLDVNDTKYSNLRGVAPSIVFDKSAIGNVSIRRLTDTDIQVGKDYARKSINNIARAQNASTLNGNVSRARGLAYLSMYAGAIYSSKETHSYHKKGRKNYIESYKREHPNSDLTNAQIRRMYNRQIKDRKRRARKAYK